MSMLAIANFFSGLAKYNPQFGPDNHPEYQWVDSLCGTLDSILAPLLIIVATAGMIYAVVLGVNLARADSAEKQQEAKKRLIYAVVGLVVILVLILFLKLFVANVNAIIGIDISGSQTS